MVRNPLRGQTVYVDANTLIYALETPGLFPGLQTHFVQSFVRGDLHIVTSWITLAEVLIKPVSSGDVKLEAYYRQLIRSSVVCTWLPLTKISQVRRRRSAHSLGSS